MSRIGKLPITIPSGVKVVVEPKEVRLEGPKGKLKTTIPPGVNVKVEGPIVRVEREGEQRHLRALHGLTRKLIANMAQGVSQALAACLKSTASAIARRSRAKRSTSHWVSHPVVFLLPQGVAASVERQVIVTLSSADRQLLGETAAKLRGLRPPSHTKARA